MNQDIQWLEPWWSAESLGPEFCDTFRKQFEREVPPGHELYGLAVKLIARGNGDDCLFRILDGSERVAEVHLTWSKGPERLPWPGHAVYPDIGSWIAKSMIPEHQEWSLE